MPAHRPPSWRSHAPSARPRALALLRRPAARLSPPARGPWCLEYAASRNRPDGDARDLEMGVQSFTGRALSPVFESGDVVASTLLDLQRALHLALLGARGETRAELERTQYTDAAAGGHANMGALGRRYFGATLRAHRRCASRTASGWIDPPRSPRRTSTGARPSMEQSRERSTSAATLAEPRGHQRVGVRANRGGHLELLSCGAVHGGTRAVANGKLTGSCTSAETGRSPLSRSSPGRAISMSRAQAQPLRISW